MATFFELLRKQGIVNCGLVTVNSLPVLRNLTGTNFGNLSEPPKQFSVEEMNMRREREAREAAVPDTSASALDLELYTSITGGSHRNARGVDITDNGLPVFRGSVKASEIALLMGYFRKGEFRRTGNRERLIVTRANPENKLQGDTPRILGRTLLQIPDRYITVVLWLNWDRDRTWPQLNLVIENFNGSETDENEFPQFTITKVGDGEILGPSTSWINNRLRAIAADLEEPNPEEVLTATVAERTGFTAETVDKFVGRT
jgi:hypothetical protein